MPHIIELFGKTRVVIKDGKVVEVGRPLSEWCPVFAKVEGVKKITREEAKKNIEARIRDLGMFTDKRRLDLGVFVSFGASEVMMTGLRRGLIDAAVTVCEGAGTVITSNPELVQGMGAQMSGLIQTEPVPTIMKMIEDRGGVVLDREGASLDQEGGLRRAAELGFKRVAVSIVDLKTARNLRILEDELGLEAVLIGVHLTGIPRGEAAEILEVLDIITGCASKNVRELVRPLLQVGTSVPLFALTQRGKELLFERAKEVDSPILISVADLPFLPEDKQPRPLVG